MPLPVPTLANVFPFLLEVPSVFLQWNDEVILWCELPLPSATTGYLCLWSPHSELLGLHLQHENSHLHIETLRGGDIQGRCIKYVAVLSLYSDGFCPHLLLINLLLFFHAIYEAYPRHWTNLTLAYKIQTSQQSYSFSTLILSDFFT